MSTKRTMKGLRETLFTELDKLVAGEIPPARARATASVANALVESVAVDPVGTAQLADEVVAS